MVMKTTWKKNTQKLEYKSISSDAYDIQAWTCHLLPYYSLGITP